MYNPTPEELLIHNTLHSTKPNVDINGTNYTVFSTSTGLKYIFYQGFKYMEQNRNKSTSYAQRARNGEKLTWKMSEPWQLIAG